MWVGRKLKTVDELESEVRRWDFDTKKAQRRSKFPILVIDDESFPRIENLRSHNYAVTHVRDLDQLSQLNPFAIILCDLQGVGTSFSLEGQGAHLIAEIKEYDADKFVISYTGGGPSELYVKSVRIADDYLRKDADGAEWIEKLDRAITRLSNPAHTWKALRPRLLLAGISPLDLAVLEDSFVRKALRRDMQLAVDLQRKAKSMNLASGVQALLTTVVPRLISHYLNSDAS